MITARLIEATTGVKGAPLYTLELHYPRFVHAEFMTHRVFSRNASSSRAIPTARMLKQVRENPAMPSRWGKNQPGMQDAGEHNNLVTVDGKDGMSIDDAWRVAAENAAKYAEAISNAGYHKQIANRLLEPFQFIRVIVTATEWRNFFNLRCHPDADPTIQELAYKMRDAIQAAEPRLVVPGPSDIYPVHDSARYWHLPYITEEEREKYGEIPYFLAVLSTARCARVSYNNHDGTPADISKDFELAKRLIHAEPLHASPAEHQAVCCTFRDLGSRNFSRPWLQFREMVEQMGKLFWDSTEIYVKRHNINLA